MLEVVGVTGVVHLGQIQSGLRSAMRIAQVVLPIYITLKSQYFSFLFILGWTHKNTFTFRYTSSG